jgi:pSer/pThr/pTyr-binding forkhead associated (FHA) protein
MTWTATSCLDAAIARRSGSTTRLPPRATRGSTNGTYLNEELLETARPLHPGDRVRIGDSEFTFEVD